MNHALEYSLILLALLICLIVYRWQNNPTNTFDLMDAIVGEDGKFSLFRAGQAVALVVSTWAFVVLVQRDKLSEFYFYGYMGIWSGINLAKNLLTKAPDGSTSQT